MERLHPSRLTTLPDHVERPRYDRSALRAGIVQLGLDGPQRALLAVVNEAAIHASGDLRWGSIGVSLQGPDLRDALVPQAGLYTVACRDVAADGRLRERLQVVGQLLDVLVAADDPEAVLTRLADDDTRIVSVSGADLDDRDLTRDLVHPAAPRSAIGLIVHAMQRRRTRGAAPVTLLSCDAGAANGNALRALVLAFAAQVDPALSDWIDTHCTFPNSMLDRIVAPTTDADRAAVSAQLGLEDASPVIAEPFLDWIVEDRFANGRPAWDRGGARFVRRAEPFARYKLRLVDGTLAALAYLGAVAGWRTVDRAAAAPALHRYLETMIRDEIAPTLPALPGPSLDEQRTQLLQRLGNSALQLPTHEAAMNGSQVVPLCLLGTVRDRSAAHRPYDRLALAIAAWIHYLRASDESGASHPIVDPLAAELVARLAPLENSIHDGVARFTAFEPVFGDLGRDPRFVSAVARHLVALRQRGVQATLDAQP